MNSDWKFKEQKDTKVYSTKQIINQGNPILSVSHNLDGAWQFLEWETPEVKDGILTHLYHIIERDPSIEELFDLPLGWRAWRQNTNQGWVREKNPYEEKS